ncbi:MAG TPA: hypothetical protein C5S37_14400 [Methanophagales archaeon]|nr:hypothetical protein [Methanophagales archaeon]
MNKEDLRKENQERMNYGDLEEEMVMGTQQKNGASHAYKFAKKKYTMWWREELGLQRKHCQLEITRRFAERKKSSKKK